MHHHSRIIVRKSWGGFSVLAPPVAPQPCAPAPPLASVAPSPLPPARQSLLVVLCGAPQVGLRGLAVRESRGPSAFREGCHQGCAVPRPQVKFWARRPPRDPPRPWPVPRPSPKPRRPPPRHLAALVRPAAAPLAAAAPVLALAGGPGGRIGMIRRVWSSYGMAAPPASSAPRFTSLASMTKT